MVLDSAFTNLYGLMLELVDVYKIRVPKFTVRASPAESVSQPLRNDHGIAGRCIALILGNHDLVIVVLPCSKETLSFSSAMPRICPCPIKIRVFVCSAPNL